MTEERTRFAFWGRCSTEDRQDPEASRAWQHSRADQLVAPRGGVIVAEYFDVDKSRSVPPARRPQASLLLVELANPSRAFDAVVVGEPQRAFYGNQFGNTFPLFEHWDVPLWVPEVGGPIDPANEAHDMIMSTFGSISKGERSRIKTRVRTTMAALAQTQGRFLGGRPPYGYVLIDAGPHPNPAKAADGKRLHVLAIDEAAAEVVRRIFAEFLAGYGIHATAERLTADGISCPSAHDPDRNRHRCGIAWSKYAIRAILTNPRYTGRQVWNRQRKDEVLIDITDVALGHVTKMRWNDADQWIYSNEIVHPPIIDDEIFMRAQELLTARRVSVASTSRTVPSVTMRCVACCTAGSASGACKATGPTKPPTTGAASPANMRWQTASPIRSTSPSAKTPYSTRSTPGSGRSSHPATCLPPLTNSPQRPPSTRPTTATTTSRRSSPNATTSSPSTGPHSTRAATRRLSPAGSPKPKLSAPNTKP
jgi:hypothetical protein